MRSAREEILGRVRTALADVTEPDAPVDWAYGRPTPMSDVIGRFVGRVEDYGATVVRCPEADVPGQVARALAETGAGSVVLPEGIPADVVSAVRASPAKVLRDDPLLSAAELDRVGGVITLASVGVAETGTIVLDHSAGQGRRALTLVPDRHICIVRADQVVSDVPEAVERTTEAVRAGRPLTWISGPSATSDIELSRVEGVHGPRTLWVIVVG